MVSWNRESQTCKVIPTVNIILTKMPPTTGENLGWYSNPDCRNITVSENRASISEQSIQAPNTINFPDTRKPGKKS